MLAVLGVIMLLYGVAGASALLGIGLVMLLFAGCALVPTCWGHTSARQVDATPAQHLPCCKKCGPGATRFVWPPMRPEDFPPHCQVNPGLARGWEGFLQRQAHAEHSRRQPHYNSSWLA